MEAEVSEYFQGFLNYFEFFEPQFAIKLKPHSNSANRAALVSEKSGVLTIQSGKIDQMFQVADFIYGRVSFGR